MEEASVFGKKVYLEPSNGFMSFDKEEALAMLNRPLAKGLLLPSSYSTLTICLEASLSCNLDCVYCFGKKRSGKNPSFSAFRPKIDSLIDENLDKSRYFLDLSGDREPLLNLKFILDAADYALAKSEVLRKEVLVTFVCNGTLLSKEIARILKKKSVLFGISLDGDRKTHDFNRPFKDGSGSFDQIMSNVASFDDRSFLGCSITFGKARFPLLETLDGLLEYFPTVSAKPTRLKPPNGFNDDDISYWKAEYDRLCLALIERAKSGDFRLVFSLLNGSDYFGKFLLRTLLDLRSFNRCDAGVGRVYILSDGKLAPCAPLSEFEDIVSAFSSNYVLSEGMAFCSKMAENLDCRGCSYIFRCGGECPVERRYNSGVNRHLCDLKRHLILLSFYFAASLRDKPFAFAELANFAFEVFKRKLPNPEFEELVQSNSDKSFAECKELYYSTHH